MLHATALRGARIALFALLGASCGGGGEDGAECLAPLELECTPTFAPTFQAFFDNERATCAASGASCHAPEGAQGGLVFSDADATYDALLGPGSDGVPRVMPGNPECSPLIQRLESDDPDFVMPRGMPLSPGERCSIRQWVANGAER